MRVRIRVLDEGLQPPRHARAGDAGVDLVAAEDVYLEPGQRAAVPTGIALAIPEGYAGFVLPRSGRALKEGLSLANAPGLIDSGYRGEVKVVVVNLDPASSLDIKRGDKIAQLVILAVEQVEWEIVGELPESSRGEGGFGSSGR